VFARLPENNYKAQTLGVQKQERNSVCLRRTCGALDRVEAHNHVAALPLLGLAALHGFLVLSSQLSQLF
jgi:hypothetical protein